MLEIVMAFSLVSSGQPNAAGTGPPKSGDAARPRDPENYEPWGGEQEIRPGDLWYRVRIDIDRRGHATNCRMTATNDRNRDRRFWTCRAFLNGAFETAPIMRDGVAVPGSIERLVVMPGRNSRDIYERERRADRARRRAAERPSED